MPVQIELTLNLTSGVEKKEFSYSTGRNTNWYSHHGEQYGRFPPQKKKKKKKKKKKIEPPHDPATPPLGIYLEKQENLI